MRVPGETQGEGGLARARLAVEQEHARLGGERVLQSREVGATADEVLRAVVGQVDRRAQTKTGQ